MAQLADIGDLVLTTPALAALREAYPRATIDLLAFEHALPIVPVGLIDAAIPLEGGASNSRAFYAPANLRAVFNLSRRKYDTVVFFHHFTLRAGVFKFWLIANACGAKRIVGLKNHNIGFLTESIDDAGFGAMHQAQYWLELVSLLGASREPRPALVRRQALDGEHTARQRQAKGCHSHRQWRIQPGATLAGGKIRVSRSAAS